MPGNTAAVLDPPTSTERPRRGLTSTALGRLLQLPRRAPLTTCFIVALWGVGAATNSLVDGPPAGWHIGLGRDALAHARWWTPFSAVLWCPGLAAYLIATAAMIVLMGPAEARMGTVRAAFVGATTHLCSAIVVSGIIAAGVGLGDPWSIRLAQSGAIGPSPVIVGVTMAATARLGVLWRRRARLVLVVALITLAVYSGGLLDVLTFVAGMAGLAIGAVAAGGAGPVWRASISETRLLVALIVAASAAGPLVAALTGTAIGPLSVARFVLLSPMPNPQALHAVCANPALVEDCTALTARLRLRGPAPAILSVLPVLVLMVLAGGLRRGRRFAWWAALAVNVLLAGLACVLAWLTLTSPTERLVAFGGAADAPYTTGITAAVAQPLLVVAVLLATRRRFPARVPRDSFRTWAAVVATTFAASCGLYTVGAMLLSRQFLPSPALPAVLTDLPARFLPPGYLGEVETSFTPARPAATALYEWTGVLFWTIALTATAWLMRRSRVPAGDAAAAHALLTRSGGSSLAWTATWSGNSYWFDRRARAAVAYRVHAGVALTCGEPFGEPDARRTAIAEFGRHCAEHGWTPCFYGIGTDVAAAAAELGWHRTQVAEETVVKLPGLAFTGRRWQDVRTALNKAARTGVTADLVRFADAPRRVTDQIREISEQWVAEKGLPEMGFTLGGLDELSDDHVRCLVATTPDGTVQAVTSWMPIYEDGVVIGWTLDFVRRRDASSPGVIEFLIATAALRFQAEGAELLSLSGAPLARLDRNGDARRAGACARPDRSRAGAGLRLSLATGVQVQVPTGVPTALPDLSPGDRTARHRHRRRPRLPPRPRRRGHGDAPQTRPSPPP